MEKTYSNFPDLCNELEARDTEFRSDFNSEQRRSLSPFMYAAVGAHPSILQREKVWQKLFSGDISEEEALNAMTDLMESYYSARYTLSRVWRRLR